MPNIPNVPGVPLLSSYSPNNLVLLFADAVAILAGFSVQQWGVFFAGIPVIASDNQISFELRQDYAISDYPTEEGGFQSYDKVQLPTDIRVRVSAGGSEINRQRFLDSIEAVMNTTDLYDVVTPEQVFQNYNFSHRDLRRTAQSGVGLVIVDLWLQEIRISSSATFQNTQSPSGAGAQGLGNVQPQSPTSSLAQQFSSGGLEVQ